MSPISPTVSSEEDARPVSSSSGHRDIRPLVYAILDILLALLYAYLLFWLIPSRHGWVQMARWLVVLAPVVMALSMIARRSWTWWSAVVGCGLLLVLAVLFLVLTLISAAFLAGVYGSLGQAASVFALIGAALIVEFMGILPALQLAFLMRRAGRRCFGKEPLWP